MTSHVKAEKMLLLSTS